MTNGNDDESEEIVMTNISSVNNDGSTVHLVQTTSNVLHVSYHHEPIVFVHMFGLHALGCITLL